MVITPRSPLMPSLDAIAMALWASRVLPVWKNSADPFDANDGEKIGRCWPSRATTAPSSRSGGRVDAPADWRISGAARLVRVGSAGGNGAGSRRAVDGAGGAPAVATASVGGGWTTDA